MIRFNSLCGVPCYYARTNLAYGDLSRTASQTDRGRLRSLAPSFKLRLEGAVAELFWAAYSPLGALQAIVSGGAYVNKPGFHSEGRAYDLGGLHWPESKLVLYRTASQYETGTADDWRIYLAVEAILRRHFGTVLGILHDRRHSNHWHIDPGTKVGFWDRGMGARSRVTFFQALLRDIWGHYHGVLDGDYGPKSKAAWGAVRAQLRLGSIGNYSVWTQFLLLSALAALG